MSKVLAQHIHKWPQVPQGCESLFNPQHQHGFYFLGSTEDVVTCADSKLFCTRQLIKKVSNINHNVMLLFNMFLVT